MAKTTHSTDKSGRITQIDTTRTRADGKTETTHSEPLGGGYSRITGRSIHHSDGTTDHYEKLGGGFWKKTNK